MIDPVTCPPGTVVLLITDSPTCIIPVGTPMVVQSYDVFPLIVYVYSVSSLMHSGPLLHCFPAEAFNPIGTGAFVPSAPVPTPIKCECGCDAIKWPIHSPKCPKARL